MAKSLAMQSLAYDLEVCALYIRSPKMSSIFWLFVLGAIFGTMSFPFLLNLFVFRNSKFTKVFLGAEERKADFEQVRRNLIGIRNTVLVFAGIAFVAAMVNGRSPTTASFVGAFAIATYVLSGLALKTILSWDYFWRMLFDETAST